MEFAKFISCAQPDELKWRFTARDDHQVQRCGKVVEEEEHHFVNVRRGDDVVIFQNQYSLARKVGQGIEKGSEYHLQSGRLKRWLRHCGKQSESRLPQPGLKYLASSNNVEPETDRVIISRVQRDPGNRGKCSTGGDLSISHPLAHQCGFAEACGSREQRKLVFQPAIQQGKQARAVDEGGMQTRRMEFRF